MAPITVILILGGVALVVLFLIILHVKWFEGSDWKLLVALVMGGWEVGW